MFKAWGDESGSVAALDPGAYLIGAAIAEADRADQLRDAMSALLLKGQKKVHWRDDTDKQHGRVIGTLADLPLESLVVVRIGPVEERFERRRRKCLERLLPDLAAFGCTDLTLESRGHADDARDRSMLNALRASKVIGPGLRLGHAPGPADPALWIADAVCGAVVEDRVGNSRWLKEIERRTTVDVVDARLT